MSDMNIPDIPGVFQQGAQQALKQQRFFFKQQRPITREFGRQTLEALRTGGVGAQIPIIQRAVEQTRAGTSGALRQAEAGLGSLLGTPFGQSMLAQITQQGRAAAATIPSQFAQQFIAGAPGFSGQTAQLGAGLAGQAYGGLGQTTGARMGATAQAKAGMMDMIGKLGQGAGSAAAGGAFG